MLPVIALRTSFLFMHAVAVSVAANIKGRIIQMGNSGAVGTGVLFGVVVNTILT